MAKLIIKEGEKIIQEYQIDKDIVTIGRESFCDVILKDLSVSRKHAKIISEGSKISIEDTESSNGTLLNQQKIKKEELKSKNVIGIGKYNIIFDKEIPEENDKTVVISKQDENATKFVMAIDAKQKKIPKSMYSILKKPPIIITAGIIVFIVFLCGLLSLMKFTPVKTSSSESQKSSLVNQGIELYKEKKWDEAAQVFESALNLDPDNKQIKEYLQTSQEAYFFTQGLNEYNAGNFEQAIIKFTQVLAVNPNQETAREYLETAKNKSEVKLHLEQGKMYYKRNEWTKAREEFKIVMEREPSNEEAENYINGIETKLLAKQNFSEGVKKFEDGRFIEATALFKNIPSTDELFPQAQQYIENGSAKIEANQALREALNYYNSGNDNQAIGWLNKMPEEGKEKLGVNLLIEKIKEVANSYNYANELTQQGKTLQAVSLWNKILRLETEPLNFFRQEAIRNLDKIKPQLLQKEEQAKELYRAGYVLKDVNPEKAVDNWKKVLELLPPDNEYYIKARKMLEKY